MWLPYISNNRSFIFTIKLPISSEDFRHKLRHFEESFFKIGRIYGTFLANFSGKDYNEHIQNYLNVRQKYFDDNQAGYLNLIDLNFENFNYNNEDKYVFESFPQFKKYGLNVMDFGYHHTTELLDFSNSYFWHTELYKSFSSYSNIWFEELYRVDNGTGIYDFLDVPILNKEAYLITPQFNSFIHALQNLLNNMNGDLILEDGHHSHVTKNGILLNNKIVYSDGRLKE